MERETMTSAREGGKEGVLTMEGEGSISEEEGASGRVEGQ